MVELAFLPKAAARPVLKVLNSAAANAVNNFKLDETSLKVKAAAADQGPVLERWRARAMGRAAPIKKRTCHITIVLTDGKEGNKIEPVKVEKKEEEKKDAPKKVASKEKVGQPKISNS